MAKVTMRDVHVFFGKYPDCLASNYAKFMLSEIARLKKQLRGAKKNKPKSYSDFVQLLKDEKKNRRPK